jgi:hypothetical protein
LEGCGLPKVSDNNTDVVQDDEGFEKADYSNENVQDNAKTQTLQLEDTLDMEIILSCFFIDFQNAGFGNSSCSLRALIIMFNSMCLSLSMLTRSANDSLSLLVLISFRSEFPSKKQEKIVSLHHIELWYCK